MKRVAGSLRINLAQYRDLEVFAQFGSDLDRATRDKLRQGVRILEVLKQPVFQPIPMERQVILLLVATSRVLMEVPVDQVKRFLAEFLDYLDGIKPALPVAIRDTGILTPQQEEEILQAAQQYLSMFQLPDEDAQHG